MRWFVTSIVLASLSAWAAEPSMRIAVMDLQGVDVPASKLSFYAEHLASSLRAPGLTVVTGREIATVLGLERQKQLLGCTELASSCLAELASALGVDAIVVGDVGRFGNTYQLNLKALGAGDAKVLAASAARVEGEVAVLDALSTSGATLGRALFERRGVAVPPELLARTTPAGPSVRALALIPLSVGVVAGGVGAALLVLAHNDYTSLTSTGTPLSPSEATTLHDSGRDKQTAGVVLIGFGAAAVVTAGLLFVLGAPRTTGVALTPVNQGAVFSVSGAFP